MSGDPTSPRWRTATQLVLGGIGIALLTFGCYRFRLDLATTSFTCLILIALLSMTGGFITSASLAIVSVACLDYFFAAPLYGMRDFDPAQLLALAAFLTTAILVAW